MVTKLTHFGISPFVRYCHWFHAFTMMAWTRGQSWGPPYLKISPGNPPGPVAFPFFIGLIAVSTSFRDGVRFNESMIECWSILIDCVIVYYRGSGDKSAILANSEGLGNEDTVPCLRVPLWTSGTKCLYCVSNLSNLGLKLLKKISILSQTCLGQNVSIWSQFETFLTFEIQLRLSLFESNLRNFSALSKSVKKVSKMSQKGIWGDLVDGRSFQVPSLYIQTLWFHN